MYVNSIENKSYSKNIKIINYCTLEYKNIVDLVSPLRNSKHNGHIIIVY